MVIARRLLLGALLCLAASCGGAQRGAAPAQVRFLIQPPTARVYVEDRFVGAARVLARRPQEFPPGVRHFSITADGHFPHDVEVDLPSGLTTIRLTLRPVPP
ncbi:MAG: hypothetical protein VYE22_37385 [Myxococcota bacterium]|nr:hypothetical protein [Myxococcota bacterium]